MATFDNSYSRIIAWLKIILPLTALAILSTLFLVSRTVDPTLSIPFADAEIRDLANQPRIGNPAFSGVAENGSAFNLAADVALPLPDGQSGLSVEQVRATFESPDGQVVNIVAANGSVNSTTRMVNLTGGVTLATSLGYSVETDAIAADIDASTLSTAGQIEAFGPLGTISAGQMHLQPETAGDTGSFELIFQNRVKLVYDPTKHQE